MAVGDANNMLARLRAILPPWFPNQGSAPVLDGILTGIATTLAFVYSLYAYAKLQTRITTATDAFLDIIAWDYFAGRFTRNPGESDGAFVVRILAEIIRPRVTRAAIQNAVAQLTGYPVRILEPAVLTDNGFWKVRGSGPEPMSFYRVDTLSNPGRWSGRGLRCQFFVECVLPLTQPFGNNPMPAWSVRGDGSGSYAANWMLRGTAGALAWGSSWLSRGKTATARGEQAVYALINSMRAAGVIAWVKFVPVPTAVLWDQPGATWDSGVKWDQ